VLAGVVVVVIISVLVLTGVPVPVSGGEPEFAGPYAADLREVYEDENAPQIVKTVLADGVITEDELAEVRSAQVACLEAVGVSVLQLDASGESYLVLRDPGELSLEAGEARTNELAGECSRQTGWVALAWLYTDMTRNPDNLSGDELMSACMVRVGLRPEGYTPERYMDELHAGVFMPWLEDQTTPEAQLFRACNDDPLHAKP
jgi:hypothetical protein